MYTFVELDTAMAHILSIYHLQVQDPGRSDRCKCISQKKMTDALICQIFTANNEKQHFLRKPKAYNEQISTKLPFPRNEYETYSQIYI